MTACPFDLDTSKTHHVTGLGNAMVDIIAECEEVFLSQLSIEKGAMTLIDEPRAQEIYAAMGPATEESGGSAANTISGIGVLGGKACYLGKVANDQLGRIFEHDLTSGNVTYKTEKAAEGLETGRCYILVTPDAERSMNTFLGASSGFSPIDVDETLIASSQVIYMEGYLFDPPLAKQAYRKAAEIAHLNNVKVSLTLSDSFCVDRHREDFLDLIREETDILFANEHELKSLFQVEDLSEAIQLIRNFCPLSAITRSEKGSLIVTSESLIEIEACPVEKVIDTTGAGDQYAAGFLYGLTQGMSLEECGNVASQAAAAVIARIGPRIPQDFKFNN